MTRPADLEAVPRHADGVVLLQEPSGARLVRPGAPAVALDATALALWELCDGETTVEEMVGAVCALYDAPPGAVAADVRAALDRLGEAGLLQWEP